MATKPKTCPPKFVEGHSKAEKAALELTAAELHNDNGMKVLDMVFKSEKVDEAYSTYAKEHVK